MTKEDLLKRFVTAQEQIKTQRYYDEEDAHKDADNALIEYINDPEIAEAFNKIRKWYS